MNIVEFLIEKGAKINAQNNNGLTPLHMAVEYDYFEVVQTLLAAGADKEVRNNEGCEARTGIEGKKCLQLLAFACASDAEELRDSLKDLLDCLETDDKELVDKADLVRAGLKHKKMNKDAWSSDPLIQSQFMSVVSAP